MSFLDTLWSRKKPEPESQPKSLNMTELLNEYDIQAVNDTPGQQFAVVSERDVTMTRELGTSSPSPWTSFSRQEYNPGWVGIKGLEKCDRMRKSDGIVRGTLRAVKTPVLSGRYFIEAGGDKKVDKSAAELVKKMLFQYSKSISWTQMLTEALLMLDFGYYMFEKVWGENELVDGKWRTPLKKLAPRHPMDVKEWDYDENGGPRGVWMYKAIDDDLPPGQDSVYIPIEKLIVFTFDREAGNIEGISILRSAYKHYYFKEQLYKIDAIQKERHGIGIPVIKLPVGFKAEDKIAAEDLGRNIRTNERAHIVLPPNWEIFMLKLEGQPVNVLESIELHDAAIRENILVNFIRDGAKQDDLVMFFKATKFVADIFVDCVNTYLIPQITDLNFTNAEYPRLRVRRIGETADWRTLSFAIRNLIGAGVIIPDRELEDNIRDEMDLPDVDEETSRLIATPQNPYDVNDEIDPDGVDGGGAPGSNEVGADRSGTDNSGSNTHNTNNPAYARRPRQRKQAGARVGLPRQTNLAGVTNSFGLPRSNAGRDSSGGN